MAAVNVLFPCNWSSVKLISIFRTLNWFIMLTKTFSQLYGSNEWKKTSARRSLIWNASAQWAKITEFYSQQERKWTNIHSNAKLFFSHFFSFLRFASHHFSTFCTFIIHWNLFFAGFLFANGLNLANFNLKLRIPHQMNFIALETALFWSKRIYSMKNSTFWIAN